MVHVLARGSATPLSCRLLDFPRYRRIVSDHHHCQGRYTPTLIPSGGGGAVSSVMSCKSERFSKLNRELTWLALVEAYC